MGARRQRRRRLEGGGGPFRRKWTVMTNPLKRILQIRNSFLSVLILIQILILTLATLLTRLTLDNINASETDKRESVTSYVTNAVERGTSTVQPAVSVLADNENYMKSFASRDRNGLLASTKGLFEE